MNNTIEQLLKRKSTRLFSEKEISREDKDLIIEAAINAPTAGNMQLYSIIEVDDEDVKNKLSILCDNQPFINKAKFVLIFLADYQKWQDAFKAIDLKPRDIDSGDMLLAMEDAIIAASNAQVASESLGISSCYIGDIMENAEKVIELLELPNHVYPATMIVFGYPSDNIKNVTKPKRVDIKYTLFKNKYRQLNKDELEDMLKERTLLKGYKEWMEAFMIRKHNSDFSKEMQRSANVYINRFKNNG